MELNDAQLAALKEWAISNNKLKLFNKGIEKFKPFVEKGFPDDWQEILKAGNVPAPVPAPTVEEVTVSASSESQSNDAKNPPGKRSRSAIRKQGSRLTKSKNKQLLDTVRAQVSEIEETGCDSEQTTEVQSADMERIVRNARRLAARRNNMRAYASTTGEKSKKDASMEFIEKNASVQNGVVTGKKNDMWYKKLEMRAFGRLLNTRTTKPSLSQLAKLSSTPSDP